MRFDGKVVIDWPTQPSVFATPHPILRAKDPNSRARDSDFAMETISRTLHAVDLAVQAADVAAQSICLLLKGPNLRSQNSNKIVRVTISCRLPLGHSGHVLL